MAARVKPEVYDWATSRPGETTGQFLERIVLRDKTETLGQVESTDPADVPGQLLIPEVTES